MEDHRYATRFIKKYSEKLKTRHWWTITVLYSGCLLDIFVQSGRKYDTLTRVQIILRSSRNTCSFETLVLFLGYMIKGVCAENKVILNVFL